MDVLTCVLMIAANLAIVHAASLSIFNGTLNGPVQVVLPVNSTCVFPILTNQDVCVATRPIRVIYGVYGKMLLYFLGFVSLLSTITASLHPQCCLYPPCNWKQHFAICRVMNVKDPSCSPTNVQSLPSPFPVPHLLNHKSKV